MTNDIQNEDSLGYNATKLVNMTLGRTLSVTIMLPYFTMDKIAKGMNIWEQIKEILGISFCIW